MKNNTVVIGCASLKGGIGKSLVSTNIAYGISELQPDKKVLLIDFDPQASSTSMLGIPTDMPRSNIRTIGNLMEDFILTGNIIESQDIRDIIYRPSYQFKKRIRIGNRFDYKNVEESYKFDVIPADFSLSFFEVALTRKQYQHIKNVDGILKKVIDVLRRDFDYDYIIIDSMPSLGPLTVNVLYASDYLLVPTTLTYHSMLGIQYIEELVDLLAASMPKPIGILGIAKNRVHKNALVDAFIEKSLDEDYPELHKFTAKIPESSSVEKMIVDKKIAIQNAGEVREALLNLSAEVIERVQEFERARNTTKGD